MEERLGLCAGETLLKAHFHRLQYAILLLLLILLLPFYYRAWSAPGFGLSHDDGIYLATAKALATGQGYTIISLPNEIRQTKYPILFPFLLSLVWRIDPSFPQNLGLLKLIPLLATAAWTLAVYRLARELSAGRVWALWLAICVMANAWVISYSGLLRPENLFGALVTWAVVFLLRAEHAGQLRPALWAALLVAAAYYTRTAAVAVIAGGFLGLLLTRRFRLAFVFGIVCAVICLPWVIWQAQQTPLPPVERYYTALCYRQDNIISHGFTAHERAAIFRENLIQILLAPASLFGFPASPAGLGACLLFWGVCAFGVVRVRRRCLQCTLFFSMLIPALWVWIPVRFLFPVIGLLIIAASAAMRNRVLAGGALLLFLAANTVSLQSWWTASRRTQLFSIEFKYYPATWPQIMDVLNWIRGQASAGDVVISSTDPMVYFYTGLKSIRGFYLDVLPVYYGLPAHANSDGEFLRLLDQYHPKYLIRIQPDLYEATFLGPITAKLLEAGFLREVHVAGAMHVYTVLQFPPSNFSASE